MVLSKNMMMAAALVALAYAIKKRPKTDTSTPPKPTVVPGYDMGGVDFGVTGDDW